MVSTTCALGRGVACAPSSASPPHSSERTALLSPSAHPRGQGKRNPTVRPTVRLALLYSCISDPPVRSTVCGLAYCVA